MAHGSAAARTSSRPDGLRVRWVARGVWTLIALVLFGWLGWLLARPFWHPRTHLVLLAGEIASVDGSSSAIPADYVVDDLRELLSLERVLHQDIGSQARPLILGSLGNPGEMQQFADRLNERVTGHGDAVLIYATAHGLSQNGDAWLLASGADPQAALGGRYRLPGLLASLAACKADTKLLILDAGRIDYDPLRGLVDNDFPSLLIDQVEQLGDGSIWVLLSHSAGERSHLSPALRRSVFGYFVAEGLKGAADSNHDQSIDLAELTQFVTAGVSNWVRQTTGNAAEQTPRLVWGRGTPLPGNWPVLVAARDKAVDQPRKINHARSIASATKSLNSDNELASEGRSELNSFIVTSLTEAKPQGRMGQYIADAARKAFSNAGVAAPTIPGGPEPPTASSSADPQAPANADKAVDSSAAAKAAPGDNDPKASLADKTDSSVAKGGNKDSKSPQDAADSAATPKSASIATPQGAKPPPVSREQLAQTINKAWRMRDELAAPDRPQIRPVDYAPHLWRELEARLLSLDRELRTGFLVNSNEMHQALAEVVQVLEWLGEGFSADAAPANSLTRQFAAARPGRSWAQVEPHSLALAELIAIQSGRAVAPELATIIARLDGQIASGNRADLEKLASGLKPEHDRWFELRVLRLLAQRPELDWRLVQLLLSVTRASEQAAAASTAAPAWQRVEVAQADATRLAAERTLLGHGSFDRDAMIAALTGSLDIYQTVIAGVAKIRVAQRLTHDVWHRLPYYLAWNAIASGAPGIGPNQEELDALLTQLGSLESLLDDPAAGKIAAVEQATARLTAARQSVERGLDPVAIEQLLLAPVSSGEAWRIAVLLETPLPTFEIRSALAAVLPEVDAALAKQVKETAEATPAATRLRTDMDRFVIRADLQHRMWHLALRHLVNPDLGALDDAQQSWIAKATEQGTQEVPLAAARERFEGALADLNHNLPARLQKGVEQEQDLTSRISRGSRLARLRAWNRALRIVDPRLLSQIGDNTPALVLAHAEIYDFLAWLRDRAELAKQDAPPIVAAYHQSVAERFRAAAAAIPLQPLLSTGLYSPIELTGPENIALTYESEQQVEFVVRNASSAGLAVWLVADWESELISLTSPVQLAIYNWSDWHSGTGESNTQAAKSASPRARPSLQLGPGQTMAIPIRLARRKPALTASHAVLRVITEQHAARHDLKIELPPPEDIRLLVAGPPARWTPTATGITLFPFPNRASALILQLANGKSVERKVDVEVFPLLSLPAQGLPSVPLLGPDAARLRGELRAGALVAEARGLALPATSISVSIPLVVPEPIAALPAAATPTASQSGAGGAPDDKAARLKAPLGDKPLPAPLTQGLLVVITDLADKRQTFKHVEIAPQRPQRYIRPQVRYRAGRQRIEIKVSPLDAALLPTEGVRIHGEIAEGLVPDAVRQLDAVLKPGLPDAEMHVDIPSTPGGMVTLQLTVDDYPRAIFYRVPTSGETSDVPEDLDLLAVRVVALPKGTIYQPPTASIPVRLEIDAPASALKNPPLRVEVGVDRNRDRELRGDEFIVLTADREAEATLTGIGKAGELEIETQVRDFTVDVPAAAIASGRANILAHAVLGEKEAWSEPMEVVIDGQAPRVSAVELRPERLAVIGRDLTVSALADDLGLSGVARLEAMFDLDRSGQFGPMAKPVAGALADDGRWSAKLPTGGMPSGAMNLLVRAVDRAGNASDPVRASVRLLSPEEAAADAKARNSADITGVVMYGDQPQAGMKVSLAIDTGAPPPPMNDKQKKQDKASAAPPLASATTDAQGSFRLPKVPPGKYVVTAEGLVRNKNRTAQQPITFQKPQDLQPLTLKLK